ncbi:MAG TPA: hypothetical protein VFO77_06945, partial [Actinoplanes sp.]|nr:hypothetical protein [Actinoplanes sp.]
STPAPVAAGAPAHVSDAVPAHLASGAPAQPSAREPGIDTGSRPAGISAFGDQRVRVPGATLAGLPDAPPEIVSQFSPGALPTRQTANGLPVRGSATAGGFAEPQPAAYPPDGPHDAGARDTGPYEAGPYAAGSHDAGLHDAGPTGTAGPVSASASVPMASRIAPPADVVVDAPATTRTPRVYGRPAAAEPTDLDQRFGTSQPPAVTPPAVVAPTVAPPITTAPGRADLGHPEPGPTALGLAAPGSVRGTATARVAPPPMSAAGYGPDAESGFAPSPAGEFTTGFRGDFGSATPGEFTTGAPTAFAGPSSPFPPGPAAHPFSEHTTDLAGRDPVGRQYGSTRADQHTAPAVDEHPGGIGPGRATVAPPGPAGPGAWPAPAGGGDGGRFAAFRPDAEVAPAASAASEAPAEDIPQVRKLPVMLAVVLVSALIVGGALGAVRLMVRPGFEVSTGDCVKRDGTLAVTATCGDADAYEVVSKVDTKEQCADPAQPHVLKPTGDGRNEVLCLKPRS